MTFGLTYKIIHNEREWISFSNIYHKYFFMKQYELFYRLKKKKKEIELKFEKIIILFINSKKLI